MEARPTPKGTAGERIGEEEREWERGNERSESWRSGGGTGGDGGGGETVGIDTTGEGCGGGGDLDLAQRGVWGGEVLEGQF